MTAAWTPDDALVEKAARVLCSMACRKLCMNDERPYLAGGCPYFGGECKNADRDEARAALIACRDDMVAEAVKAEAEACAATLDAMAESHQRAADAIADQGHMDIALGFKGASTSASECAALIRARHP